MPIQNIGPNAVQAAKFRVKYKDIFHLKEFYRESNTFKIVTLSPIIIIIIFGLSIQFVHASESLSYSYVLGQSYTGKLPVVEQVTPDEYNQSESYLFVENEYEHSEIDEYR